MYRTALQINQGTINMHILLNLFKTALLAASTVYGKHNALKILFTQNLVRLATLTA